MVLTWGRCEMRVVRKAAVYCVSQGLCAVLGGWNSWVAMGINDVKYGVRLHSVFFIDLVIGLSFFINVKSFNSIHESAFSGSV